MDPSKLPPIYVGITLYKLHPNEQQLIHMIQELGFGWVENLTFRSGFPVFDPPPKVVRKYRLGRSESDRSRYPLNADFKLKTAHVDMLVMFRRHQEGYVQKILVHDGLPGDMEVTETPHV